MKTFYEKYKNFVKKYPHLDLSISYLAIAYLITLGWTIVLGEAVASVVFGVLTPVAALSLLSDYVTSVFNFSFANSDPPISDTGVILFKFSIYALILLNIYYFLVKRFLGKKSALFLFFAFCISTSYLVLLSTAKA